jgi:DNA-binding PadR family transcriptional regulator
MYPDHHWYGDRLADGRLRGRRRHHLDHPARTDGPGGHKTRGGRLHGAGRGRAQRGDVRTALLLLLAEEPMHGYQLMQAITERTSGAWRPSPGAIYPTLSQLEDEGLIDTVAQGGRKLATLTDAGHAYLQALGEPMPDPFAEFTARCGSGSDLRGALEELRYPIRQLAMGDAQQVQDARRVLAEARRSLYLILAGAPTLDEAASDQ